ncbi:unnamed protein product [Arctia plantaginis]|uniref:Uncharacterized protein n=1 Tax=Arctia plantaginis TaxID=874455 RepID=A0A8S1B6F3_ARCPL|nr:unnamed protein product [Arctia plantaginis]CAB3258732.1 unnamed protein product [Arctia plantaginis]
MKYLVIFLAVLAVLAAVQAKPFLPGLDVVQKAVGSLAGGAVGGAAGAVKGGVDGIKNGLHNGVDFMDVGRGLINQ